MKIRTTWITPHHLSLRHYPGRLLQLTFFPRVRNWVAALVLPCAALDVRAQDVYNGQSQLFFDATGLDQAAYGANQIITVSGNLTYFKGCTSGRNDLFYAAANIYVVRHGDMSA